MQKTNSKWVGFSRAIIGVLMMVAGIASQYFGWVWWPGLATEAQQTLYLAVDAIGGVLAFVGRVRAARPLHIIPKPLKALTGGRDV